MPKDNLDLKWSRGLFPNFTKVKLSSSSALKPSSFVKSHRLRYEFNHVISWSKDFSTEKFSERSAPPKMRAMPLPSAVSKGLFKFFPTSMPMKRFGVSKTFSPKESD